MGWPVSATHTIIGAVIGFALITIGSDAIQWDALGGIVGAGCDPYSCGDRSIFDLY